MLRIYAPWAGSPRRNDNGPLRPPYGTSWRWPEARLGFQSDQLQAFAVVGQVAVATVVQRRNDAAAYREVGVAPEHLSHMRAGRGRVSQARVAGCHESMGELVGRGDVLQRLQGLCVLAPDEMRARQVTPEARWMKRVELHRLQNPRYPCFRLPDPCQDFSVLDHDQVVIGIEIERPLLVVQHLVELVAGQVHSRQDTVDVAVVVVQRPRYRQLALDFGQRGRGILTPAIDVGLPKDAGRPGVCMGVHWVELDGAPDQCQRPVIVLAVRAMVQLFGLQHAFVGDKAVGRLALGALPRGGLDAPRQYCDDRRSHRVLDREDVFQVAIVTLGPHMPVGLCVDQLYGDAHAVAGPSHAAFDDVLHPEVLGDLPHVDRLAFEFEGGVARDHEQIVKARQVGQDVLGQTVGEELLLRHTAHVGERQHDDRRLDLGDRLRRFGTLAAAAANPVHAHRPGNVVQLLLAGEFESQLELAVDLVVDLAGDADAAYLGQRLQACGDIHAVAVGPAVLDEDFAKIHPDAKGHAPVFREPGVALCQLLLHGDGRPHRIDGAAELRQHVVARRVDNATAMRADDLRHQAAAGGQHADRFDIVVAHQAAEAGRVCAHDGGQAPLYRIGAINCHEFYSRPEPRQPHRRDGLAGSASPIPAPA